MTRPPQRAHRGVGVALLLIDGHRLALDALTATLSSRAWTGPVLGAATYEHVARVCAVDPPDVAVVAMHADSGLAELDALRNALPPVPAVAWAVGDRGADVVACVRAGAAALLDRSADEQDLREAVLAVLDGRTVCSPRLTRVLLQHVASGPTPMAPSAGRVSVSAVDEQCLTPREREVLVLIERGRSNKEIAAELGVEVRTVKNHVHNLLHKLRVSRRGEAAARLRAARVPSTRALQAEPVG